MVQIMHELVDGMSANDFEVEPLSREKDEDHSKNNYGHDIGSIYNPDDHVAQSDDGANVRNGGKDKVIEEEKSSPTVAFTMQQVTEMVKVIGTIFETAIRDYKNKENENDDSIFIGKMLKQNEKKETPLLIAAKHGIIEMVECILQKYPVAVHQENIDGKNIVLIAVESRQPHIYNFLLKEMVLSPTIFYKTDKDGNSALHLAARLGKDRPWLTHGVILQMQWETKWHEFVQHSMPPGFFIRYNKEEKTAIEIFSETHDDLAVKDRKWLSGTSTSCSVVAALVATVAFTASTTIPGGVKSDDTGTPALQNEAAFTIFAISSLVALGFSVTSVVMFLAILTARHQEIDFRRNLPVKLLVAMTSLFISIACMLLCFCAGHFLVLKDKFELCALLPLYEVTCLPLTFFAILQFPQYVNLVIATMSKVPQRFPSIDRTTTLLF